MDTERQFSKKDIVRILEIGGPLLEQWMLYGFVRPSKPAKGKGTKNLFSLEDIITIGLFKKLIQGGFSRQQAKKLTAQTLLDGEPVLFGLYAKIWDSHPDRPIYIGYIHDEDNVRLWVFDEKELRQLSSSISKHDAIYIVNVRKLITDVCEKAGIVADGTKRQALVREYYRRVVRPRVQRTMKKE